MELSTYLFIIGGVLELSLLGLAYAIGWYDAKEERVTLRRWSL